MYKYPELERIRSDDQAFQDTDEYRLWASVNKGFGRLHLGATGNYLVARDGKIDNVSGNSDMLTLHFHADYYLADCPISDLY